MYSLIDLKLLYTQNYTFSRCILRFGINEKISHEQAHNDFTRKRGVNVVSFLYEATPKNIHFTIFLPANSTPSYVFYASIVHVLVSVVHAFLMYRALQLYEHSYSGMCLAIIGVSRTWR